MLEYDRFSPRGIATMDKKTLDPTVNDTDMDEEILIVDTSMITQTMDAIRTPAFLHREREFLAVESFSLFHQDRMSISSIHSHCTVRECFHGTTSPSMVNSSYK